MMETKSSSSYKMGLQAILSHATPNIFNNSLCEVRSKPERAYKPDKC